MTQVSMWKDQTEIDYNLQLYGILVDFISYVLIKIQYITKICAATSGVYYLQYISTIHVNVQFLSN